MQIASGDTEEKTRLTYSVIVTHSQSRSQQIAEFLTELTHFSAEVITVINCDETGDINDSLAKLRKARENDTPGMSVVLVATAGMYLKLLKKSDNEDKCYSIVLDKVDLLQAFGFKPELEEIAGLLKLEETEVDGKVIMTTAN